jgi:trans-2,3-dihydro-3-hydroxyanthranilate isomerase
MALPYLHYDVFTHEPLLGNQLAVFTDARGLTDERMQRLAREMNFSESTFVLPAEQPGTDVRMRIFTPGVELPIAGHPTIGTAFALAHAGRVVRGAPRVVFGLNIGPTPVDLEWRGSALGFAWMSQPAPTFGRVVADRAAAAAAIGLEVEALATDHPVQPVSCGVPYLLVPLRDRAAVDAATSQPGALPRLFAGQSAPLPIYLFALEPPGSGETVYARMFGAALGIGEDPATGSASGPLGCYLVHHALVAGEAARRIAIRQGVAMGRASRIHVSIDGTAGRIDVVKVGGEAVLVGTGEILV